MADEAFPLPGVTTVSTIGDWESLFYPAFQSGVVTAVGDELAPSLDTAGRNAVIGTGGAILRAFYKPVSASTPTPIPAASSQNRIDRLVLRLDRSQTVAANFIVPAVITGTPGSSPQLPALTQTTTGLWELPVAHWTSSASGALTGLTDDRSYVGAQFGAGAWSPVTAYKKADDSWGATTTLTPDPDLIIPMTDPAGVYRIQGAIRYDCGNVPLYKHKYLVPAGAALRYSCMHHQNGNATELLASAGADIVDSYGDGPGNALEHTIDGLLIMAGTPGSIQLTAGTQQTGGAGWTHYMGSYLSARKVN